MGGALWWGAGGVQQPTLRPLLLSLQQSPWMHLESSVSITHARYSSGAPVLVRSDMSLLLIKVFWPPQLAIGTRCISGYK